MLIRTDTHVSAALGEELAMLDVDRGSYYVFDEVGTFLWEQLERPVEVASLLVALQDRYDVAPQTCEADVLPFLTGLLERGLVRHAARRV